MTVLDYLKRVAKQMLAAEGIPDGKLDTYSLGQMKRGVVSKGKIVFEAGDYTLVAPPEPGHEGDLSAFSFRTSSLILVHSESLQQLSNDMEMPDKVLQVCLANRGNPDFDQDPSRHLPGTRSDTWVAVSDYAEASAVCRAYIDENDLGGGNWSGGIIRNALTHVEEARVSYNGRVWAGVEYTPAAEPLFDPSVEILRP